MGSEGEEKLFTVQEAAVYAGMGETGIRNAILRGKLPYEFQYGRKLIKRGDLDHYKETVKMGRPKKTDVPGEGETKQ